MKMREDPLGLSRRQRSDERGSCISDGLRFYQGRTRRGHEATLGLSATREARRLEESERVDSIGVSPHCHMSLAAIAPSDKNPVSSVPRRQPVQCDEVSAHHCCGF